MYVNEHYLLKDFTEYTLINFDGSVSEPVYVIKVEPNYVVLTLPIKNNYPVGSAIVRSVAGIRSGDLIIFSNSSNEMYNTAIHEMLHHINIAGLSDVESEDNLMHFEVNSDVKYKRLRYRNVKFAYKSGSERQWIYIKRN